MFSRIGNFINPSTPSHDKSDAVARPGQENRKDGRKKDEAPAEQKEDDTLFSIEAIRALLRQENIDAGSEALACLDLLQQNGIDSIPIRNEQSIIAAITEAAAHLRAK